jgi:hypothetical protein
MFRYILLQHLDVIFVNHINGILLGVNLEGCTPRGIPGELQGYTARDIPGELQGYTARGIPGGVYP